MVICERILRGRSCGEATDIAGGKNTMKNSSRFFANKECEYYPCHKMDGELNCLFCYCPLYCLDCPGQYTMIDRGDHAVKSCMDCTFPHEADNYDLIMELLRRASR